MYFNCKDSIKISSKITFALDAVSVNDETVASLPYIHVSSGALMLTPEIDPVMLNYSPASVFT